MTLNWEVTSVASAHTIGEASLGTGRFRAARRGVRIRITGDRRIPQAAEQRLENVLGRGRSHRGEKHRDRDLGHEDAFDAAAQAGLATDQQSEGPPTSRADDPQAHHLLIPSAARRAEIWLKSAGSKTLERAATLGSRGAHETARVRLACPRRGGGLFRLRRAWPGRLHARSVDQREPGVYALATRGDR